MDKKLPKVFANEIYKDISNNDKVHYGDKYYNENKEQKKVVIKENINNKINRIFKSTKYVYKIDVEITINGEIKREKIIGRNSNNLITLDRRLIPITSIQDIKEI